MNGQDTQDMGLARRGTRNLALHPLSCRGLKHIRVKLCNIQLVLRLSSAKTSVQETEIVNYQNIKDS